MAKASGTPLQLLLAMSGTPLQLLLRALQAQ
jgi:hypothetical protein